MKLSHDEKELIITNRRPTGLEKPDFSALPTLGADAGVFQLADLKRAKQAVLDRCLVTFTEKKSNASCKIKDITGFLFGGFNSRFWAMRKHINTLSKRELQHNLPFFCWDCIAIETKARTIDLVIPDQEQMNDLLKFLIYELRTSDGDTGSSEGILRAKLAAARTECLQMFKTQKLEPAHELKVAMISEQQLCHAIFRRYCLIRVRQKISYHALLAKLPISELFYLAILKTYQDQVQQGDIDPTKVYRPGLANSEGMFRKYFGEEVDARNFHETTPDAKLIGHSEFLANHGHYQHQASSRVNCKKASFVNATTLMEIKSNFAKITSKDNGGDIFRHLAQEASA